MDDITLRPLDRRDWSELSDLICASLNHWHQTHGRPAIFRDGPEACAYMPEIYEALDPGCCVVAVRPQTGRLMGGCFWHERPTHVSVGIMAVHPNYAGKGVASRLLKYITDVADRAALPTRLVSSAINLDSFSLYNRAGFVPIEVYQDMVLQVPAAGLPQSPAANVDVRDATPEDLPGIEAVEWEVSGIRRPKDFRFFLDKPAGDWSLSVATRAGANTGFLTTLRSARGATLGPGVARDDETALALLRRELDRVRGYTALVLLPSNRPQLIHAMYAWGARNVEIHLAQVRGAFRPFRGITFPTFMPESG
jgi:GNAT superfamily N-acetyltransferase